MSGNVPEPPAGWSRPKPEELAPPTHWPAVTALGAFGVALGVLTSPIISAAGGVVFIISLAGWIGEMRHEKHPH